MKKAAFTITIGLVLGGIVYASTTIKPFRASGGVQMVPTTAWNGPDGGGGVYYKQDAGVTFHSINGVDSVLGGGGGGGGAVSWTTPTLLNSWVNFGAPYSPAGYWKDSNGVVHLEGSLKSGSSATAVMFQLPAGYRPSHQIFGVGFTSVGGSPVTIDASGNVSFYVGATTVLQSVDLVSFPAEQ